MPSAQIRINQPANASPTGAPGVSRDDIIAGSVVELRNVDNNGVTRHFWGLLDRPEGSAAALANPISAVATLTPDVAGTYRIYLRVNDGRGRRGMEAYSTVIVRDAAAFRAPAYNEGAESNFLVGPGIFNEVGPLHEYRRRMMSSDNRVAGVQYTIANGASQEWTIDWPLPDAQLVYLEITATASTDTDIDITADAAYTQGYIATGVDATTPIIIRVPTLVTRASGAGVEANKVYFRLRNNNLNSDYDIRWRIQAL